MPDQFMTFLAIKVKPGSAVSRLSREPDGTWKASIKSRPVEGQANEELIRLVAAEYGVPRSAVSIKSGATSRNKLVKVNQPARGPVA